MSTLAKRTNPVTSLWSDFFDNDRFFSDDFYKPLLRSDVFIPPVNIIENEAEYRVEVGAPGMKKEDFKIDLNEDSRVLTISAETKEEKKEDNKKDRYTRQEYAYHSFSRSFSLPENVNPEAITGKYENGVMILTIGKKATTKSAKKEIKVE